MCTPDFVRQIQCDSKTGHFLFDAAFAPLGVGGRVMNRRVTSGSSPTLEPLVTQLVIRDL